MNDFLQFLTEQWLLVSALIVLFYLYTWREAQKGGQVLPTSAVTQLLNQDKALLLDVRPADEFKGGHIVDALNIPYASLTERVSELEAHRDKVIVIADKIGQHAAHVGRQLRAAGFDVRRLQGGINEWQAQRLPLVKG